MTSTRALAVVGVAGVLAAAVWVAAGTDPSEVTASQPGDAPLPVLAATAPEVVADEWINTEPLGAADLAGRVVLYDFWTFGCVNCKRTIPYVKAWHDRYAADGLVVVSIHTPEFAYERDASAVADFVAAASIGFPVALDPDKRTWRAFANRYWPAFYLHDRDGRRRYVHFGEGRYDETEDAIRALLGIPEAARRAEEP